MIPHVVLICISLIITDVEHLFGAYWSSVYLFSSSTHLFFVVV